MFFFTLVTEWLHPVIYCIALIEGIAFSPIGFVIFYPVMLKKYSFDEIPNLNPASYNKNAVIISYVANEEVKYKSSLPCEIISYQEDNNVVYIIPMSGAAIRSINPFSNYSLLEKTDEFIFSEDYKGCFVLQNEHEEEFFKLLSALQSSSSDGCINFIWQPLCIYNDDNIFQKIDPSSEKIELSFIDLHQKYYEKKIKANSLYLIKGSASGH